MVNERCGLQQLGRLIKKKFFFFSFLAETSVMVQTEKKTRYMRHYFYDLLLEPSSYNTYIAQPIVGKYTSGLYQTGS